MQNYSEQDVREINYCGFYTEKDEVLDNYKQDINSKGLLSRTSKTVITKVGLSVSHSRNGRVKVHNIYDELMTTKEFLELNERQKLIVIEEYKTRHGLLNAAEALGVPAYWFNNQREMALKNLEKQGIDGKQIIAEHKAKHMKFDKETAVPKKRHNRKMEMMLN